MNLPRCWACEDRGLIVFDQDGYETVAHCTCGKGKKYAGPSMICINKFKDSKELVEENFNNFWITLKPENKAVVFKELRAMGVDIPDNIK